MSDRSAATLHLHVVPDNAVIALEIRALLDQHDLRGEDNLFDVDARLPDPIIPGTYMDDEASLTIVDELGGALAETGATFELYQDAKYEWPGSCWLHVPDIGSWQGECDNDGSVTLTGLQVDRIIDTWLDEPNDYAVLLDRLNTATGRKHREHFASLRAAAEKETTSA